MQDTPPVANMNEAMAALRQAGAACWDAVGMRYLEALDKRLNTDGRPNPGVEVRIVDDSGHDVGPFSRRQSDAHHPPRQVHAEPSRSTVD